MTRSERWQRENRERSREHKRRYEAKRRALATAALAALEKIATCECDLCGHCLLALQKATGRRA